MGNRKKFIFGIIKIHSFFGILRENCNFFVRVKFQGLYREHSLNHTFQNLFGKMVPPVNAAHRAQKMNNFAKN